MRVRACGRACWRSGVQLFAVVPMGGQLSSQLGSLLAGPSVVPEAQMLGAGPEMYNCMDCACPPRPARPARRAPRRAHWCCVHAGPIAQPRSERVMRVCVCVTRVHV